MMNGSRIITGQFSLYSRYPRRMTHLLEEAARVRSFSASGKSDNSGVVSVLRSQNESRTDEEIKKLFGLKKSVVMKEDIF